MVDTEWNLEWEDYYWQLLHFVSKLSESLGLYLACVSYIISVVFNFRLHTKLERRYNLVVTYKWAS
jgi:hypothetical protein